jgi:3-oxoacyl-[acyl-carrier protein] reductase
MTTAQTDHGLAGRVALVTGAGRGIGRAIALALAAEAAHVALLARSQAELDGVAQEIRALGGQALVLPADVGDRIATESAVKRARADLGQIDVLINNAAVVWPLEATAGVAASEWSAAIGINLIGPVSLTLAVLPDMLERRWGRIVNVSSRIAAGPAGMIGGNAYATSKAALEAHTLNLAAELAGSGVTVNAYRPGAVDTSLQEWIRTQPAEKIGTELRDRFANYHKQGTLLTPERSAAALLDRMKGEANGAIWDAQDT